MCTCVKFSRRCLFLSVLRNNQEEGERRDDQDKRDIEKEKRNDLILEAREKEKGNRRNRSKGKQIVMSERERMIQLLLIIGH